MMMIDICNYNSWNLERCIYTYNLFLSRNVYLYIFQYSCVMQEKFNADSYIYYPILCQKKIIVIYRRYIDTVLYNDNNIVEYNYLLMQHICTNAIFF